MKIYQVTFDDEENWYDLGYTLEKETAEALVDELLSHVAPDSGDRIEIREYELLEGGATDENKAVVWGRVSDYGLEETDYFLRYSAYDFNLWAKDLTEEHAKDSSIRVLTPDELAKLTPLEQHAVEVYLDLGQEPPGFLIGPRDVGPVIVSPGQMELEP